MKLSPVERMKANARCWLAEADFPPLAILDDPPAQSDRCYLRCTQRAVDWADLMMDRWTLGSRKGHQPLGYPTVVRGWRERGSADGLRYRWGAQVNLHRDQIGGREFLELDFDRFSPQQGALLALGHAWEWIYHKLWGARTNPYMVARKRGWLE